MTKAVEPNHSARASAPSRNALTPDPPRTAARDFDDLDDLDAPDEEPTMPRYVPSIPARAPGRPPPLPTPPRPAKATPASSFWDPSPADEDDDGLDGPVGVIVPDARVTLDPPFQSIEPMEPVAEPVTPSVVPHIPVVIDDSWETAAQPDRTPPSPRASEAPDEPTVTYRARSASANANTTARLPLGVPPSPSLPVAPNSTRGTLRTSAALLAITALAGFGAWHFARHSPGPNRATAPGLQITREHTVSNVAPALAPPAPALPTASAAAPEPEALFIDPDAPGPRARTSSARRTSVAADPTPPGVSPPPTPPTPPATTGGGPREACVAGCGHNVDCVLSCAARPHESASGPARPEVPSRDEVSRALASVRGSMVECLGGRGGTVRLDITFASSGRVTTATVGLPFAGTPVGSCLARAARSASVPPFTQPTFHVTVARQMP